MSGASSVLAGQIQRAYDGSVDGSGLVAALRESVVVVPTDGHNAMLTCDDGNICWVYAFTDTAALARFALTRGEGERQWSYLTTRGARLVDVVAPAIGRPAGIAVDVGNQRPMLFPPMTADERGDG